MCETTEYSVPTYSLARWATGLVTQGREQRKEEKKKGRRLPPVPDRDVTRHYIITSLMSLMLNGPSNSTRVR